MDKYDESISDLSPSELSAEGSKILGNLLNEHGLLSNIVNNKDQNNVGSLIINLCDDGSISVSITHQNSSDRLAAKFGELLYHLNEGNLKGVIAQQLNIQLDIPLGFFKKVIQYWNDIHIDCSDEPFIDPIEALSPPK